MFRIKYIIKIRSSFVEISDHDLSAEKSMTHWPYSKGGIRTLLSGLVEYTKGNVKDLLYFFVFHLPLKYGHL